MRKEDKVLQSLVSSSSILPPLLTSSSLLPYFYKVCTWLLGLKYCGDLATIYIFKLLVVLLHKPKQQFVLFTNTLQRSHSFTPSTYIATYVEFRQFLLRSLSPTAPIKYLSWLLPKHLEYFLSSARQVDTAQQTKLVIICAQISIPIKCRCYFHLHHYPLASKNISTRNFETEPRTAHLLDIFNFNYYFFYSKHYYHQCNKDRPQKQLLLYFKDIQLLSLTLLTITFNLAVMVIVDEILLSTNFIANSFLSETSSSITSTVNAKNNNNNSKSNYHNDPKKLLLISSETTKASMSISSSLLLQHYFSRHFSYYYYLSLLIRTQIQQTLFLTLQACCDSILLLSNNNNSSRKSDLITVIACLLNLTLRKVRLHAVSLTKNCYSVCRLLCFHDCFKAIHKVTYCALLFTNLLNCNSKKSYLVNKLLLMLSQSPTLTCVQQLHQNQHRQSWDFVWRHFCALENK